VSDRRDEGPEGPDPRSGPSRQVSIQGAAAARQGRDPQAIGGVFPLVGPGSRSEMRRSLGTAGLSGMIGVGRFGVFLTPVIFFCPPEVSCERFAPGGGIIVGAVAPAHPAAGT
jgi:hypothetical protein